jgi:hypothetical protein
MQTVQREKPMVAWKRFPVPEFDYGHLKGMTYVPPVLLDTGSREKLVARGKQGDASAYGGHPVSLESDIAKRFGLTGEQWVAVLCIIPNSGAHLLGRSHAWRIQRGLLLDLADPSNPGVVADWKTPRPMNTLLGPATGIRLAGGAYLLFSGQRYGDGWIPNRIIIDNAWSPGGAQRGFRVVAASDPELDDFHDSHFVFSWSV